MRKSTGFPIARKVHANPKGVIIAACDADLLGEVFEEGKKELNLKRHASFYDGDRVDEAGLSDSLKNPFSSINLVGKTTVAVALALGLFKNSDIKKIANVPYVHVYRL